MQKDIQLTGIGNALLDIEVEVSDQEIANLNFQKGTMALVDSARQNEIFEKLGNRTTHQSSGGSAANTVIAFSSFGGKAAYKTILGHDKMGDYYAKEFQDLGIILDAPRLKEAPTGTCTVLISTDSERTLCTNLGANATYGRQYVNDEIIKRSEWIYIEGYKLTEQSGTEAIFHAIDIAKKYDTKIAFTFSDKFIVDVFRTGLDHVFNNADLIFCNELEAKSFTNTDDSSDAVNKLLAYKDKSFAITLGAEGSIIRYNGADFRIKAYPVKAIDSTGAGDMYAAGVLYGLINWNDVNKAGHLGSLAASRVVSHIGARLKESHTDLRDTIYKM